MSESERSVKFAPCDCTADAEDWRIIDREENEDSTDLVYGCETCGGQFWTSIDSETVA